MAARAQANGPQRGQAVAGATNTKALFHQLFLQAAGKDRVLSEVEMERLALSLAAQLRIPTSVFGEVRLTFHRYDFSGDGLLDETEGLHLIEGMMRTVEDARDPRAARAGMMKSHDIPQKRLENGYTILKKLGQGGQGAVMLAKDRSNNQDKVVKFYDKSDTNAPVDDIIDEFALLTKLDHPKIARIYEIFQDRANIYVVGEPYFGGDLSTIVEKANGAGVQITEQWFAGIFKQSLEGVAFLHSKHMMHCDIKEANIMISDKGSFGAPNVVVIDFGLAKNFSSGELGACGTPGYMPPEVWASGLWTPKGDTFAMGVTFYSMVTFQGSPFVRGANSMDDVQALTCQCRLPPPNATLQRSPLLNQMLTNMLARDFRQRPAIRRVLEEPWIKQASPDSVDLDTNTLSHMHKMKEMKALQEGLLADMASRENLTQMQELSETFASMDTDNDGTVTADEARRALQGTMSSAKIEQLVTSLIGESGSVPYTLFMGKMMAAKKGSSKHLLRQIFEDLDKDNSGHLDQAELRAMLSRDQVADAMGGKGMAEIMREYGWDQKASVTWDDFRDAFEKTASPEKTKSKFRRGDEIEYYSPSYGKWVPSQVIEVRSDGAIQIGVKPGFYFKVKDQKKKIRPVGGSAASHGLNLLHGALGMIGM